MEIPEDFKELLELLNANEVDYVIVGGHALAFYGAPRFTGDLDICVGTDPGNARKVIAGLDEFGFGSLGLTADDFSDPDTVVQLGYPPVRVDIMTSITGVGWDEIQKGKVAGDCGGARAFYIGRKEFVVNKRATGRRKDLADLEALGEVDSTGY